MNASRWLFFKLSLGLVLLGLLSLGAWQTYRGMHKQKLEAEFHRGLQTVVTLNSTQSMVNYTANQSTLLSLPPLTVVELKSIQIQPNTIYLRRFLPKNMALIMTKEEEKPQTMRVSSSRQPQTNPIQTQTTGLMYSLWQKVTWQNQNLWVWVANTQAILPMNTNIKWTDTIKIRLLKNAPRIWQNGENCEKHPSGAIICQNLPTKEREITAQLLKAPHLQILPMQNKNTPHFFWQDPPNDANALIGIPSQRHFAYALTWFALFLCGIFLGQKVLTKKDDIKPLEIK